MNIHVHVSTKVGPIFKVLSVCVCVCVIEVPHSLTSQTEGNGLSVVTLYYKLFPILAFCSWRECYLHKPTRSLLAFPTLPRVIESRCSILHTTSSMCLTHAHTHSKDHAWALCLEHRVKHGFFGSKLTQLFF